MKKKSTFRDFVRSAARKSAAVNKFEARYNSELHADENDAPDAVAPRYHNDYGDPFKGMAALPTNIADPKAMVYDSRPNPKAYPASARGQEAIRNFTKAYLRD